MTPSDDQQLTQADRLAVAIRERDIKVYRLARELAKMFPNDKTPASWERSLYRWLPPSSDGINDANAEMLAGYFGKPPDHFKDAEAEEARRLLYEQLDELATMQREARDEIAALRDRVGRLEDRLAS